MLPVIALERTRPGAGRAIALVALLAHFIRRCGLTDPQADLEGPGPQLLNVLLPLQFHRADQSRGAAQLPWAWAAAAGLALLSVAAQAASGQILFGGDAVMAGLYLLMFVGAMTLGHALGHSLDHSARGPGWSALDCLAAGTMAAAMASVAIALGAIVALLAEVQVEHAVAACARRVAPAVGAAV